MPTIRPETSKPLIVNLKYRNSYEKKVNGITEFKYTLENGDALFVPPIAHDEIQKLHAGAGEPFTLTKSIGQGNQAVWKVERILPDGPENAHQNRPVVPSVTLPKHTTNGRVSVMPVAAPTLATPQSKTLIRQLIATIDAVKVARDYAKQQGVEFEPTSRDICALAITGGIQVFKEGVY
jgi:hypothetical protein